MDPQPQGQQAGAAGDPQAPPPPQGANNQNAFGGRPGPGLQPQGQGNNNNRGFIDRLFGNPGQPQNNPLHGQFPHIQNPDVNGANLAFAGQAPPGVVIQYHIQYQQPRQPQQPLQVIPLQPQPLQPLQPPPQFQGFPGPGGVWQPWRLDRGAGNGVPNTPQPPQPTLDTPTPTSASTSSASTATEPQPQEPLPTTDEGTSNEPDRREPTPREAAALAAFRRLNTPVAGSSGSVKPNTQATSTSLAPASTQPREDSEASNSDSNTRSSPSIPTPSSPVATPPPRSDIPQLIPLHDYGTIGAGPVHLPNNDSNATPHFLRSSSTPGGAPQTSQASAANSRAYSYPRTAAPRLPDNRHQQATSSRSPISQLPPTLTDEQLAIMDRLTREAIDERLRVLERVSGAVYRCIDDLMRMRSTLPTSNPVPAPVSHAATSSERVDPSSPTAHPPAVLDPDVVTKESVSAGKSADSSVASTSGIIDESAIDVPEEGHMGAETDS